MVTQVRPQGKVITEAGLQNDLRYLLAGIDCHQVLSDICPPRPGLQVLEPGCGSGKLGLFFAMRGAAVTLLDLDPQAIAYAQELDLRARLQWPMHLWGPVYLRRGSIFNLEYDADTFDFVFNEGVPHHWGYILHDTRRQRALNQMVRVCRPGGWVAVIGSNIHCPATVKMAETTQHTYPGMPPRQKPFTREELRERLVRAGLDPATVRVKPVSGWPDRLSQASWGTSRLLVGYGSKSSTAAS